MINFVRWIIVGGSFGWIISMIMRTAAQQGPRLNIIVGIMGAVLAGLLLGPLFDVGAINQDNFNPASLLIALVGADILLGVVTMCRRAVLGVQRETR